MLQRISIKNIALIREQSIEFSDGLNVITGETGAGKSLVLDSLSLLLGERADKNLITKGESFASVEAVFTSLTDKVKNIMIELGLEEDDTLIISRKITVEGKNECRVNGSSFTLSMLKKLTAPLMDLHGQFEHQNLLKVQNHLSILDSYGGEKINELKVKYIESFNNYKQVLQELSDFTIDDLERNRLIELYGYQIEEIDNAGFYCGEEEELKAYRNQVLHQERIVEALDSSKKLCSGDNYEFSGAVETLKKIISVLSNIVTYYEPASGFIERLESVKLELDDVSDELESSIDNLYFDEEKAKQNEDRLDLLSSFKKKYGFDIDAINEYRNKIGIDYEKLINSSVRIEELKKLKCEYEKSLLENAKLLSKERNIVAKSLENEVKSELKDLGMKSADFVVRFEMLPIEKFTNTGMDKVEFMFSANLGESVKPLKDVASGGEMSRFMLAIKNITAQIEGVSTLIFDEIDTGVSGLIALVLAQKLSALSKVVQVICVTHLTQIASFGNSHYYIEKNEIENRTITRVTCIEGDFRVREIARLISGNITETSLINAKEMLLKGENFYKNLN